MTMAKKNETSKALQSVMAKYKKIDADALKEWEIACNTNNKRGKVYNQSELKEMFNREDWDAPAGASKLCHILTYIVVKRHKEWGYIADPHREAMAGRGEKIVTGNQLVDEINCWQKLAETSDADLLCPILKFFTSKSDKVSATSEKMQDNVVIISQKAEKVGDAWTMCKKAEVLNDEKGLKNGEDASERYKKMEALSAKMGWRDALGNDGNSGIIFDYSKGCYKAVFIDYAL